VSEACRSACGCLLHNLSIQQHLGKLSLTTCVYLYVYIMCDVFVLLLTTLQLRSVHFVWAVRNWKDILYFEDVLQMLQQHQATVANGNSNGNANGNTNGKQPTLALSASIYLTGGDKNGNNDWLGELPQYIAANLKQVEYIT
jgi:predicted ferric reductase